MIVLDDFENLQREVAELHRQRDQTIGQFQEMKKQVRKDFGCKKLPEALKLLDQMHEEMIQISELYVKKKRIYEKRLAKAKKQLES